MAGGLAVRRARSEDAAALAAVHVRTWQEAYPGLVPQDYLDALSVEERTVQWRQALAETDWPRHGTFVLEEGGEVAGFALVRPSDDDDAGGGRVGEVALLYVRPATWGRGGGAALLQAALAELRTAGFDEATLWVLGTNERARRFYERCGWAADGAGKVHDWVTFTADDVRYRIAVGQGGDAPGEAPGASTGDAGR